MVKITSHILYK